MIAELIASDKQAVYIRDKRFRINPMIIKRLIVQCTMIKNSNHAIRMHARSFFVIERKINCIKENQN